MQNKYFLSVFPTYFLINLSVFPTKPKKHWANFVFILPPNNIIPIFAIHFVVIEQQQLND